MKFTAIKGTSVFIVLEHSWIDKNTRPHTTHDAVVHGVYSTRAIANNKILKLYKTSTSFGYFCVLKKTIEGQKQRIAHVECKEFGLNDYIIKE